MSPVHGKVWFVIVAGADGRMVSVYAVALARGKGVERIHKDSIPLWVLEIKIIAFIKDGSVGMMQLENRLIKCCFLVFEFDGFIVNCVASAYFDGL